MVSGKHCPLPCAARVRGTDVRSTHLADRAEDAFETEASPDGMPWRRWVASNLDQEQCSSQLG